MPETFSALIVHICSSKAWEVAQKSGEYRAESLKQEGFIHCSRPDQVLSVANHLYRGTSDLLLLWIDPQKVKPEIRWEVVGNEVFPHIYGALNTDAVLAALPFTPDNDGVFRQLPSPAI